MKAPQAIGPLKGRELRRIQDDLRVAGHLQQVAGVEIDERKARLGVDQKIAERVEEEVAGKVRDSEAAVGIEPDETGPPPAVRNIDAILAVLIDDIGRNEERVGMAYESGRGVGEPVQRNDIAGSGGGGVPHERARGLACIADSCHTIARRRCRIFAGLSRRIVPFSRFWATGAEFDSQQANAVTVVHSLVGWVGRFACEHHIQMFGIGCRQEAWTAGAEGGPDVACGIDGAQHDER